MENRRATAPSQEGNFFRLHSHQRAFHLYCLRLLQSQNCLHVRATRVAGKQVQDDAISVSLRATQSRSKSESDGNASQDLVSGSFCFAFEVSLD